MNAAQHPEARDTGLGRRWLYLMPVVFVTYSLAYLGRSNFGFGAAAGLAKSLNITESRAAFLAAAFFLGYFLFQVPAATYAVRRSATRLVGWLQAVTGNARAGYLSMAVSLILAGVPTMFLRVAKPAAPPRA